jgi:branched-chain amino acid transport system substrate-binding protein
MKWLAAAFALVIPAAAALAAEPVSGGVVKIGVLNDPTGPYADTQGPGSYAAARLAIEDFGPTVLGKPIRWSPAITK